MLINELLVFGIASAGITFITVYGKIFNKIRPNKESFKGMGHLFHCPMCFGFWVGAFLCGINDYTELFTFDHTVVNYFLCGAMGSVFSYAFSALFGDNGFRVEHTHIEEAAAPDESRCQECKGPRIDTLETIVNDHYEPQATRPPWETS